MITKIIYNKGEIINGLEFIEDVESKTKIRKAKFKCHCGKDFVTQISSIKNGATKSCGCLKTETMKKRRTTHGDSLNYLYITWISIKQRCYYKKSNNYHRYGGRGITMFEPWINDYSVFKKWILTNLGERPNGYSIDRIENDGNYEPNNLSWATRKQQANNRCNSIKEEDRIEYYKKYQKKYKRNYIKN